MINKRIKLNKLFRVVLCFAAVSAALLLLNKFCLSEFRQLAESVNIKGLNDALLRHIAQIDIFSSVSQILGAAVFVAGSALGIYIFFIFFTSFTKNVQSSLKNKSSKNNTLKGYSETSKDILLFQSKMLC